MKKLILFTLFSLQALLVVAQKEVKDTTTVATIDGKEYVVIETTYDDSSIVIKKRLKSADASAIVTEYSAKIQLNAREAFSVFGAAQQAGKTLENIEASNKALIRLADTSLLASNIAINSNELIGSYDIADFGTITTLTISAKEDGSLEWVNGAKKGSVAVYSDNIIALKSFKKKVSLNLYKSANGAYSNLDGIFTLTKQ